MRKLPEQYPQIYNHSQEAKCLVKTNAGYSGIKRVFDVSKGEIY